MIRAQGIIFDCDGVLILNTNEIYDEALNAAVHEVKPDVSQGEIDELTSRTRGKSFKYQLQQLLEDSGPKLNDAIQCYERYVHDEPNFRRIKPLAGIAAFLQNLANSGYVLALATGMNPSLLARLFGEGVLPEIFRVVGNTHDIADARFQKPHPTLLANILGALRLPPSEAVHVGDTWDDVEMARLTGVYSIAVLTGRLDETQAVAARADLVLDSVLEIPKWLQPMNPSQ